MQGIMVLWQRWQPRIEREHKSTLLNDSGGAIKRQGLFGMRQRRAARLARVDVGALVLTAFYHQVSATYPRVHALCSGSAAKRRATVYECRRSPHGIRGV